MARFVKINKTFINIDEIKMAVLDSDINQVIVYWSDGTNHTYEGEQATNILQALEVFKLLSIAV